jgi:hypothetical protein
LVVHEDWKIGRLEDYLIGRLLIGRLKDYLIERLFN